MVNPDPLVISTSRPSDGRSGYTRADVAVGNLFPELPLDMKHIANISPLVRRLIPVALLSIDLAASQATPTRAFRPEDMFRVQRVGAIAWAPDGRYATIEFTRPGQWLDTIPNNDLALLDVRGRSHPPAQFAGPGVLRILQRGVVARRQACRISVRRCAGRRPAVGVDGRRGKGHRGTQPRCAVRVC